MRYSGVFVNVSALPGPGYLEISLDLNDRYRIRFLDGDLAKGELVIGPSYAIRNGMDIYTVPLPAQAADSGFDQLHIVPIKGDGKFSLGHIRFPASETGVGD